MPYAVRTAVAWKSSPAPAFVVTSVPIALPVFPPSTSIHSSSKVAFNPTQLGPPCSLRTCLRCAWAEVRTEWVLSRYPDVVAL